MDKLDLYPSFSIDAPSIIRLIPSNQHLISPSLHHFSPVTCHAQRQDEPA